MSWTDLIFILIVCNICYRLRNLFATCIFYFYLWIGDITGDLIMCGLFALVGDFEPWRLLLLPRFRRLRDTLTLRWRNLRARRREKWRALYEPSRGERFLYTIMLMSYDEIITYKDTTTPYRSGKQTASIIHHASPLERIFGVGIWPFT
jgi:hypothetical protein